MSSIKAIKQTVEEAISISNKKLEEKEKKHQELAQEKILTLESLEKAKADLLYLKTDLKNINTELRQCDLEKHELIDELKELNNIKKSIK